jgi:hypothetical protein
MTKPIFVMNIGFFMPVKNDLRIDWISSYFLKGASSSGTGIYFYNGVSITK